MKIAAHDGRHKIADKREQDIYNVISRPNPDIPVFVVRKEEVTGWTRTLHRNLPMPNKTGNHGFCVHSISTNQVCGNRMDTEPAARDEASFCLYVCLSVILSKLGLQDIFAMVWRIYLKVKLLFNFVIRNHRSSLSFVKFHQQVI